MLWGLVEASGSGGSTSSNETTGEWGTRSAREDFAKTVSNALFKHSARASSKRDVEINTSSEQSSTSVSEQGSEQTIERQIENVNVRRTLNLVFRQIVQEYISVLHLTDVKIALNDESPGPTRSIQSTSSIDSSMRTSMTTTRSARESLRESSGSSSSSSTIGTSLQQFLEQVDLVFPQRPRSRWPATRFRWRPWATCA